MNMALKTGKPEAAQLVASECVVTAKTKDHQNWELMSQAAEHLQGEEGKALKGACEKVEDEEDEHLYHSVGWSRELWIDSLGLLAVLPPPEEERDVNSAGDAARAKKSRNEMTFPQFRGHLVKPLSSSLRTRLGSDSRAWSDAASDCRTPQCTRRYPVSLRSEWRSADGTRARA